MKNTWLMAMGDRKGWLIALGLWLVILLVYLGTGSSRRAERLIARFDPKMADVISCAVPLGPITGGMTEPGNAADDYHQAVMECIANDYYKSQPAISKMLKMKPEEFPLRGPDYIIAGARKREMVYTGRHCRAADWTRQEPKHYKAFDLVTRYCLVKQKILTEAGRLEESEALLKALMVFGYHIEQERVRLAGVHTGVGIQLLAGGALLQLYKQAGQEEQARRVQTYLSALREVQDRVDTKAGLTVSRLVKGSPVTAALMWVVENDRDRMWRIEAILGLGITKWTAPLTVDRDASRERLRDLREDEDSLIREAAEAGLAFSPEDVRKVR